MVGTGATATTRRDPLLIEITEPVRMEPFTRRSFQLKGRHVRSFVRGLPRILITQKGSKMAEVVQLPIPPIDRSTSRRRPFIEPAPLVAVLIDQLEYLISHASRGCPPGCPDCSRLEQVQNLLLIPFDSPNMAKAPEPLLRESVAPPSRNKAHNDNGAHRNSSA